MKTYAMRNMNADYLKDTNICDIGCYVWTPYLNIKSKYRDDFEIFDDEEYAHVHVPLSDIDELLDDPYNYDWNIGSDFDEYEYETVINIQYSISRWRGIEIECPHEYSIFFHEFKKCP